MLVVRGKELLQRPLRSGVDRVADRGDVAGGVAGILSVVVNFAVEDVPEFLDVVVLIFLVVPRLANGRVELLRFGEGFGSFVLRPILLDVVRLSRDGVLARERVYLGRVRRFFFERAI